MSARTYTEMIVSELKRHGGWDISDEAEHILVEQLTEKLIILSDSIINLIQDWGADGAYGIPGTEFEAIYGTGFHSLRQAISVLYGDSNFRQQ